jgi:hypothetical protein
MFVEVAYRAPHRAIKCSTRKRQLYLIASVTTLRSVPSCLCTDEQPCLTITGEALESLLLRNDFVDAQVLSAIWPVEFDRYKVSNAQHVLRLAGAFYPVVWSVQCAVYPHSVAL